MTVYTTTGRTLHIHFVHSSHLEDNPMSSNFGLPATRHGAGAIRVALDRDAELVGRRLTLCSISEVTDGSSPTYPRPDGSYGYPGSHAPEVYQMLGQGVSICHPNDTFKKPIGRKTSLTMALKASGLNYTDRSEVWDAYHAEMPDK